MIVMDIKLDNIFAFKNFHANFSYPKKIVNSNIEEECLHRFPNFRYKKVNVLMGTNASGKTTLGRSFVAIFNFIQRNNPTLLVDSINDRTKEAFVSIDFVTNDTDGVTKLYRVSIKINNETDPVVYAAMNSVALKKGDNYEKCAARLDLLPLNYTVDVISLFDTLSAIGWYFSGLETKYIDEQNHKGDETFINVLNLIIRTFDSFITNVQSIDDNSGSLLIQFSSGDSVIYHNGEFTKNILSRGTESAIAIAEMITNVMLKRNGFYYFDEKFSYVHSALEKSILSVLIELLGEDQQMFFTTHNTDILDLDLPKHTFSFFKKNAADDENPIRLLSASEYMKKESDSLRNAVENDLFSVLPDETYIYKILDLKGDKNEQEA